MTKSSRFPRASEAEWQALATGSGRVPLSSLTSRSDDGLAIGPLYPAAGGAPVPGRAPGSRWTAMQRIDGGDASTVKETIKAAITGGATGIALVFRDAAAARGHGLDGDLEALAQLANDTLAEAVPLRLEVGDTTVEVAGRAVPTLVRASGRDISLVIDPIATLAARGALARPVDETFGILLAVAAAEEDAGKSAEVIVADGRPWHDGGATEAQELAAVVGAIVAWLRFMEARGLDPARSAGRLGVILAADADQFLTIAKFRAARMLIARVLELSRLADTRCRVHAETSWRMISRRDPYLNMLRATGAAFAAATGGADSITVLPFNLDGDAFADRMARNAQTILLDEAALFRVGDPGAGAGAIDSLTAELAEAAWEMFRSIEAEGGLLAAVRSGTLQKRIAAKREERQRRVARREIEIVGVNIHIDRSQPLPQPVAATPRSPTEIDAAETVEALLRARLAEPFEWLCDRAQRLTAAGLRPTVFMANLGRAADFAAATATAADAFAAGGVEALDSGGSESLESAARAFRESGATVACITAGRSVSDGAIAEAAGALKSAGAGLVVFCDAGMRQSGGLPSIDAVLDNDADLPALLGRLLESIAVAAKNGQNHLVC